MSDLTISIVVPALNEEDNLRNTVEELIRSFEPSVKEYEILVFDDKSTDRTALIADELESEYKHVRAFHNASRKNIGGIYKEGLRRALYDYFMLIPGDHEVIIDKVIGALAYLRKADVVIFYHKNDHIRPWIRQVLSCAYTAIVNCLFFTNFKYTNDTNIYRKSVLDGLEIKASDFSYQTETLLKVVKSGIDFVELGKDIRPRKSGESKALSLRSLFIVCKNIVRLWVDVMFASRRRFALKGRKILSAEIN